MKRAMIIVLVLIVVALGIVPAMAAVKDPSQCERKGQAAVIVGYKKGDPDKPRFKCVKQ